VDATRNPGNYGLVKLERLIRHGASPRAAIYLMKTARAKAFLEGRDYVLPEDVKSVGMDVLRHRVATTYKAEADDISSEDVVDAIFDRVEAVPS
jgi:MoxR-like ATPase